MNRDFVKYHIREKTTDSPSTELVVAIVLPVVVVTVFLLLGFYLRTKLVNQNKKNKMERTDLPPNYADLELPGGALEFTPCQPPSYEDIFNEKRFTTKKTNTPSNDGVEMVSETAMIE